MAEITTRRVQLWQVVEAGYIGQSDTVWGQFDTPEEAWERHREVLQKQPSLSTPGVLSVRGWFAELVVPPDGGKGT